MKDERKQPPQGERKTEDLPRQQHELAPEQAEAAQGGIAVIRTEQTRQISVVQEL
jgi:hypothetical protein